VIWFGAAAGHWYYSLRVSCDRAQVNGAGRELCTKTDPVFSDYNSSMTDLSEKLMPRLLARRLPGLPPLPSEFVLPDLGGGCIANLPGQVAAWLGAGPFGAGTLPADWVSALDGPVTRVVMVLVDALGFQRFQSLLQEPGSAWDWLQQRGVLAPLTSVFPSTTTAALTSLSSGLAPGRHGMLGYEMWLKEFGVTANMIQLQPMAAGRETGSLTAVAWTPIISRAPPSWRGIWQSTLWMCTPSCRPPSWARADAHEPGPRGAPPFSHSGRPVAGRAPTVGGHAWRAPTGVAYWPMVDTLSHQYGPRPRRWSARRARLARCCARRFWSHCPPRPALAPCLSCWPITGRWTRRRGRNST